MAGPRQTYLSDRSQRARVVLMMPEHETSAMNGWAVSAGMTSRTAAIRFLVRKGLEAVTANNHRQQAG